VSNTLKLLGNEIALSSANSVSNAGLVLITNPTAAPIVMQVNAGSSQLANLTVLANSQITLVKQANATLVGSGLVAVAVAYTN